MDSVEDRLLLDIGFQCAPLLSGIKVSNLLILKDGYSLDENNVFENTELSLYKLYCDDKMNVYLVYSEELLKEYISKKDIKDYLYINNYASNNLTEMLSHLAMRYTQYMKKKSDFPHELGVFLGYPLQDVTGFIDNKGQNYIINGYWKVYADTECTRNTFSKYARLKEYISKLFITS